MNKTYRIEIRLSKNEFDVITQNAGIANVSKSEYIRNILINGTAFVSHAQDIAKIVCAIQTEINKAKILNSNPYIDNIETEANKIWPFLKS